MGSLGLPELLVIFLIVLLLFGGSRIKDVGKSLGDGIREFKKAMNEPSDKKKDGETKK
jgi:sec-independent protein translocase protein TatA